MVDQPLLPTQDEQPLYPTQDKQPITAGGIQMFLDLKHRHLQCVGEGDRIAVTNNKIGTVVVAHVYELPANGEPLELEKGVTNVLVLTPDSPLVSSESFAEAEGKVMAMLDTMPEAIILFDIGNASFYQRTTDYAEKLQVLVARSRLPEYKGRFKVVTGGSTLDTLLTTLTNLPAEG